MIAWLCESPLTFQAIIIWRDELNEGKVFLRNIIELEASYAGPKVMPAPVIGPDGQPIVAAPDPPPAAPAAATPFKGAPSRQSRGCARRRRFRRRYGELAFACRPLDPAAVAG